MAPGVQSARELLVFVVVMPVLFVAFMVVVSKLPDDNPLKCIPSALSYRVGATLGAGAVALPVESIPLLDALCDIGIALFLNYSWLTTFRDPYRAMQAPPGGAPRLEARKMHHVAFPTEERTSPNRVRYLRK
jgi:hypothetical protein